jgi:hypothetical protein
MTDPRYTRGTASRNVVQPQWIIWVGVAFFLAGILVLVGWRQMRNDPTDVQLALKNIDERLGRIEQTLNEISSNIRFGRTDPAVQNQPPNRTPSDNSPKVYLNETEIDVVRQSLQAAQKLGAKEGKYRIGQLLVGLAVKRIPDDLASKIPQLAGLLYTVDPAITRSRSLIQETTESSRSFEFHLFHRAQLGRSKPIFHSQVTCVRRMRSKVSQRVRAHDIGMMLEP